MNITLKAITLFVCLSCIATKAFSSDSTKVKDSDKFDLKINLRGDYRGTFSEEASFSNFTMKPMMVTVSGTFNPMFSYCVRQRFDNPFEIQADGLPASTLMAYVDIKPVKGLNIRLGKQAIAFGSMEFDYNPIDVYFYSLVGSQTQGFSTGAMVGYSLGKQSFAVQTTKVLDPAYMLNDYKSGFNNTFVWSSDFFNGAFKTLWSYTLTNASKDKFLQQWMIGNQINVGRIQVDLDYLQLSRYSMYELGNAETPTQAKTTDRSYLANVRWFLPKDRVTLSAKCVYDESRAMGTRVTEQITSSAVVEYNLIPKYGLSLHAAYAFRINNTPEAFSDKFTNANENMFLAGFSWNFQPL